MVEEKKSNKISDSIQLTLDNFDELEENDPEYGHLTAHLVEEAPRKSDTSKWTRVFSRDDIVTL